MARYTIYWEDKLNKEPGDEFPEFSLNAKDKTEARKKGRKKACDIQKSEFRYRKQLREKGDKVPLIKKPLCNKIKVTDIDKE